MRSTGVSKSGSDWQEFKVDGARDEEDAARHARLGQGLERRLAGRRFLLQPLSGARQSGSEKAAINEDHQRLLPQGRHAAARRTRQIIRTRRNPQRFHIRRDDRRRAASRILTMSRARQGQGRQRALRRAICRSGETSFTPVLPDDRRRRRSTSSTTSATSLLVETNHNAPNERVILVDPQAAGRGELEDHPAGTAGAAAGRGTRRRQDRSRPISRTSRRRPMSTASTARSRTKSSCPGRQSPAASAAITDDARSSFYTFNSLNTPPTIYRYDIATKKSTDIPPAEGAGLRPDRSSRPKQVFYSSKDGTTSARCSSCTRRA